MPCKCYKLKRINYFFNVKEKKVLTVDKLTYANQTKKRKIQERFEQQQKL